MIVVTVLLGALACVLAVLVATYAAGEKDERKRADSEAARAESWKRECERARDEARDAKACLDVWKAHAQHLERRLQGIGEEPDTSAAPVADELAKEDLTVGKAARQILRLYAEELDRASPWPVAGVPLGWNAGMAIMETGIWQASKAIRDFKQKSMERLVLFLVDKARAAEAAEHRKEGCA